MAEIDALVHIGALLASGRFADARLALSQVPAIKSRSTTAETLRVQVLERTGQQEAAESLAQQLLEVRTLPFASRSACHFSLGLIRWDRGNTSAAVEHFQRSVKDAESGGDLWWTCWAQFRLLVSLSGQGDEASAAALLQAARRNALRLGDPIVTAALHVFMGEIEAKRGLSTLARRHTRLAQSLLRGTGNVWLESLAENTLAALSIMQLEVRRGLPHAERALALARQSGAVAAERASLANLGTLQLLQGKPSSARYLLEQAYEILPNSGEHANGILDGLAQCYLAEGRLAEAEALLNKIEATFESTSAKSLFSNRHALLTRVDVLARAGHWREALTKSRELLELVTKVSDRGLQALTLARIAELEAALNGSASATGHLRELARLAATDRSPSHIAHYELAMAATLRRAGAIHLAAEHLERSESLTRSLGCVIQPPQAPPPETQEDWVRDREPCTAASLIQDISGVLLHAERPDVFGLGVLALVERSGCALGASLVRTVEASGASEVLRAWGRQAHGPQVRRFALSRAPEGQLELLVISLPDAESEAALSAIGAIIHSGLELERAREERQEKLTFWPLDELPAEGDDAVLSGRMQTLMGYARKIASTNVTVLITGESGTGKEVLARAIHRYSQRSRRPFVPFNCTSVPRDLMESQLFGFRRGAFTGADRDNPGLIRSAKDGTLFLDEVGDLSLELQPKLLRFIESGEIHPLGEPTPLHVNVRIVAATNANLLKMVREGKFREDLYYRLNVIPIELPPLRERRDEVPALAKHFALRWATELTKGNIRISDELMQRLVLCPWPGNIRQLSNEINRMVAHADPDAVLRVSDFRPDEIEVTSGAKQHPAGLKAGERYQSLVVAVAELEREMIKSALETYGSSMETAAKALGISRKGLYLKRQRLGL